MSNDRDDRLKRLIKTHPQDFVTWLLQGAQFQESLATELKNRTIHADLVLGVLLNGQKMGLQIELQKKKDNNMGRRALEYNILATYEHQCPMLSCIIYLWKDETIEDTPLIWELPNGQVTLAFFPVVIKLWEIPVETLLQAELPGLLPLLPLAQDGQRYEVIDQMVAAITATQQFDLLSLGQMVAGLMFTDEADHEELRRRFAMYEDILEDSWVYQEILEKGLKKGMEKGSERERQRHLSSLRPKLLTAIETRFPKLKSLAQEQVSLIQKPEILEDLLLKVAIAQTQEEAQKHLLSWDE